MPAREVTVLAPTLFEYLACKLVIRDGPLLRTGIGLVRGPLPPVGPVIVAGLAGGLTNTLPPGTVFVPHAAETESGQVRACAPELVSTLSEAARRLGFEPRTGTLLTARTLITGDRRDYWAARGFVAADMETALLPPELNHFATIRVILDTPGQSIGTEWAPGARRGLTLRLLHEGIWLAGHAPRYALRAAQVVREALRHPVAVSPALPSP